jgi:TonB family protein
MKKSNFTFLGQNSQIVSGSFLLLALCLFSFNASIAQSNNEADYLLANAQEETTADLLAMNTTAPIVKVMTSSPIFKASSKYANVNEYISENLIYPEEAKLVGRDGSVNVRFEIMENGSIGQIAILNSPDEALSAAVTKLIEEMPKWSAALAGNIPMKSVYQLKVNFRLQ